MSNTIKVGTCAYCKYFDKEHSFCHNDWGLLEITRDDYCSKFAMKESNADVFRKVFGFNPKGRMVYNTEWWDQEYVKPNEDEKEK